MSILTILILNATAARAELHDARRCAELLNVPAAAAPVFAAYVNTTYLTPLRKVKIAEAGLFTEFRLNSDDGDEWEDDVYARVQSDSSERPRVIRFEDFRFSDQLDPAFVYRNLLAHLLAKFPNLERIDFDFYTLPDYGRIRGELTRGRSIEAAVRDSDAYHAFAAFGFALRAAQANFLDRHEPRELVLRMRLVKSR